MSLKSSPIGWNWKVFEHIQKFYFSSMMQKMIILKFSISVHVFVCEKLHGKFFFQEKWNFPTRRYLIPRAPFHRIIFMKKFFPFPLQYSHTLTELSPLQLEFSFSLSISFFPIFWSSKSCFVKMEKHFPVLWGKAQAST